MDYLTRKLKPIKAEFVSTEEKDGITFHNFKNEEYGKHFQTVGIIIEGLEPKYTEDLAEHALKFMRKEIRKAKKICQKNK